MMLEKENQAVQILCNAVFDIGKRLKDANLLAKPKTSDSDVISKLDIEIDRFLVEGLSRNFPSDKIISEESSLIDVPAIGRVWVIDPLCGSTNASKQINFFCTNIVLVVDCKVIAAWVVDHSRGSIIWSTGRNRVFKDSQLLSALTAQENKATLVDFDWGHELEPSDKSKYARFVGDLIMEPDISVYSLCSSLAFAYIATGQIDAAITLMVKPWDVIASCFLVEQNGGFVINRDGSPWSADSRSVVLARSKHVGKRMLELLHKNGLK